MAKSSYFSTKISPYDALVRYLEEKDMRLEKTLFKAVLKSLNYRLQGESAVTANKYAFMEVIYKNSGSVPVKTTEHEEAKKIIANVSREVWKYYVRLKEKEKVEK